MRKIKRKVLLSSVFSFILIASLSAGFSAYLVTNSPKGEISVNPNDIVVKEENQTFLSYESVSRKIFTYDDDIVSDIFSISFNFNQKEYNTTSNILGISTNSGIGAKIKFDSNNLYEHVKNNVKNSFVTLSYENYSLEMENNKVYTSDGQNCLYFENESKTCFFHISVAKENANSNFYVQKIAEDNKLLNDSSISDGKPVDNVWSFNINFNFNIIDDKVGYSISFDKTSFANVSITLFFEDYR